MPSGTTVTSQYVACEFDSGKEPSQEIDDLNEQIDCLKKKLEEAKKQAAVRPRVVGSGSDAPAKKKEKKL